MAKSSNNLKAVLQDTANAIRTKTSSVDLIEPRDFADTISSITKITYTPEESSDVIKQLYSGTVVNANVPDGVSTLHPYLFYQMSSLESVDFNEVEVIPIDCCRECTNLENITFSLNTTRINEYAFYNCTKLTNISIPHTITYISNNAFYNVGNSYSAGTHTFDFIDDDNVETFVGDYSFSNSHISHLKLSATYVGSYAFSGCSSLLEVELLIDNGVLKDYAFQDCRNIEKFTFNSNSVITDLGSNVFRLMCDNIPNAIVSEFDMSKGTFTTLQADVWRGCKFNGDITMPSTLTTISGNFLNQARGNWTFYFKQFFIFKKRPIKFHSQILFPIRIT